MEKRFRWARRLTIAGLALILLGLLDPLEGSVVILIGSGMLAAGAHLVRSRHRRLLASAFVLSAVGVSLLFGVSAIGGLGGDTGRSMWWVLILVPYPAGWAMSLIGGVKRLREPMAQKTSG